MDAGAKLKALREKKGLSQADCAKAMNIDRTTYAKYEAGGSIRRNVEKLAAFFNVSADYLLGCAETLAGEESQALLAGVANPTADPRLCELIKQYPNLSETAKAVIDGVVAMSKAQPKSEPTVAELIGNKILDASVQAQQIVNMIIQEENR